MDMLTPNKTHCCAFSYLASRLHFFLLQVFVHEGRCLRERYRRLFCLFLTHSFLVMCWSKSSSNQVYVCVTPVLFLLGALLSFPGCCSSRKQPFHLFIDKLIVVQRAITLHPGKLICTLVSSSLPRENVSSEDENNLQTRSNTHGERKRFDTMFTLCKIFSKGNMY